jgi:gluconolactonase
MNHRLDRDWNAPVRYPDPAIETIDERFARYRLGSAALERVWTGARWSEVRSGSATCAA